MGVFDLYHPVRDKMQSGDLIEWHTEGSPVSALIRLFSGQDFNHSSLVMRLPDDFRVGYEDKVIIIEAVAGGIKTSYLSHVLADHHGKAYWSPLKDSEKCDDATRKKIAQWAVHQALLHTKYDYGSIFKNIFGRVNVNASQFFCSEFYQMALSTAGIIAADMKALRPGEFQELKLHLPSVRIG
jgi:hypothetical protein